MEELCHLPGFRHDAKLIEETGKFDNFCFDIKSQILEFPFSFSFNSVIASSNHVDVIESNQALFDIAYSCEHRHGCSGRVPTHGAHG